LRKRISSLAVAMLVAITMLVGAPLTAYAGSSSCGCANNRIVIVKVVKCKIVKHKKRHRIVRHRIVKHRIVKHKKRRIVKHHVGHRVVRR
jgi:hypothetical protein